MKEFARVFWNVSVLRLSPSELPYSVSLLGLCFVLLLPLMLLHAALMSEPVALVISIQLFDVMILSAFVFAVLHFKDKKARFVQSMTALFGAALIVGLIGLPFTFLRSTLTPDDFLFSFTLFASVLLLAWELTIRGFVFYKSFDVGPVLANFMSFTLFICSLLLSAAFLIEPAK